MRSPHFTDRFDGTTLSVYLVRFPPRPGYTEVFYGVLVHNRFTGMWWNMDVVKGKRQACRLVMEEMRARNQGRISRQRFTRPGKE